MTSGPAWQWPTDKVSVPHSVKFSRSLDGRPHEWEALIYLLPGESVHQDPFSLIWLRNVQNNEHFVICDTQGNAVSVRLGSTPDPYQVRMVCAEALTYNKVARLFYLNEAGQLRESGQEAHVVVTIRPEGRGLWNSSPGTSLYESYESRAPFRLPSAPNLVEFMRRPAPDVWQELTRALSDPQSGATFARDWTHKTYVEREDAVWNCSQADRSKLKREIEEWLRCLLLSEESLWQEHEEWYIMASYLEKTWLDNEDVREEAPVALNEAIARLWRHYIPFDLDVLKHECARQWKAKHVDSFATQVHQPSAHERLEAVLRWREWEHQNP